MTDKISQDATEKYYYSRLLTPLKFIGPFRELRTRFLDGFELVGSTCFIKSLQAGKPQ